MARRSGRWLLYGANGYTGRLTAERARAQGMGPTLGGRNRTSVEAVARSLRLESRVFDLDDHAALVGHLKEFDLVLHCAGPFSATAWPMLEACAEAGTHYLDITGEIDVFEYVHARAADWRAAGILALPGAGFDVVPSDCLAAMLKRELPTATSLRLAFKSRFGRLSPGTAKTMIEGVPRGGRVRRDGRIVSVPPGHRVITVVFESEPETAVAIPWGDVSTAYYSTGIPNIEVYMGADAARIRQLQQSMLARWLAGLAPAQWFLKRQIARRVAGPTPEERAADEMLLWGEVTDDAGGRAELRLRTPEGYTFTAEASLAIVARVLKGDFRPGAMTPSLAYGADFVLTLPGVRRQESPKSPL